MAAHPRRPVSTARAQPSAQQKAFDEWFAGSKVVDPVTAAPRMVYHGTLDAGFTEFSTAKIDPHHTGFFFTSSPDVAETYGSKREVELRADPGLKSVADVRRFVQSQEPFDGMKLVLLERQQVLDDQGDSPRIYREFELYWEGPRGYLTVGEYRPQLERADLARLAKDAVASASNGPPRSGSYRVYLSFQNPLVVDAQGAAWNGVEFEGRTWKITQISAVAKSRGYDGLIVKNTYDSNIVQVDASDVFVAFDSRQVKSATHNRGTFDRNDPNILHRQETSGAARPEVADPNVATPLTPAALQAVHRGDLAAALRAIAEGSSQPVHRALATRLAPLLQGITQVSLCPQLRTDDGRKSYGCATSDGSRVWLSTEDGQIAEETVLHECVHAGVQHMLERAEAELSPVQRQARAELALLWEAARKDDQVSVTLSPAAHAHMGEFVAEAMTHAAVREALEQRPWKLSTMSTMWRGLKDGLLGMLGMPPRQTMLVAVMAAIDRLMERPSTGAVPRPQDNPAFRAWFGKSQAIDQRSGQPLVVYHGTHESAPIEAFAGNAYAGWFTSDNATANKYSATGDGDATLEGAVYPAYIAVQRALDLTSINADDAFDADQLARLMGVDAKELQDLFDDYATGPAYWNLIDTAFFREWVEALGRDGIKIMEGSAVTWAVMRANQIKSAIGNRGTFDPNDANILHQSPAQQDDAQRPRPMPAQRSRSEIQAEAKAMGLPANGKTEDIARLVNIARADPRTWSRQEFDSIVQHLFIHQDLREGSHERMPGILAEGLSGGMVDSFGNMVTGKYLTWGRHLKGSPAYLFLFGQLKFKSSSSPWLSPGCKPLFAITPTKGQDFFEAMRTAVRGHVPGQNESDAQSPTSKFEQWSAGTHVVDERTGKPRVVYHGTTSDFAAFEANSGQYHFSSDPAEAHLYAPDGEHGSNIIPAYLSIRNPLVVRSEDMMAAEHWDTYSGLLMERVAAGGHDGVIVHGAHGPTNYIVFQAEQIKSAISNRGTFDLNDPSILHQAAWHGTPRSGIERFSTEHIGTGEGAQTYGWGLYFAQEREVADFYRKKLSTEERYVDGKLLDPFNPMHQLALAICDASGDVQEARDYLEMLSTRGGSRSVKDAASQALALLDKGHRPQVNLVKPEGGLYAVEIPEDDCMLLWDEPLSKQPPKVRDVLPQVGLKSRGAAYDWRADLTMGEAYRQIAGDFSDRYVIAQARVVRRGTLGGTGASGVVREFVADPRLGFYDSLVQAKAAFMRKMDPALAQAEDAFAARHFDQQQRNEGYFKVQKIGRENGQQYASQALAALGVKGIKYLDGDSRINGQGTYNYVIFDGDDVELVRPKHDEAEHVTSDNPGDQDGRRPAPRG